MKILAIVQARTGSTRFPNKVLQKINGNSLIELLFFRLSESKLINEIILATSISQANDILTETIIKQGYSVFRGSESDVLDRYYQAAKEKKADVVVRITGDCPLVDAVLVDDVIEKFFRDHVDYCSNASPPTFPDGLDIEVFSFQSLEKNWLQKKETFYREHVTPWIRESDEFKKSSLEYHENRSDLRWTVDEPSDFEVIKKVFDHFHPDIKFGWLEVLELYKMRPEIFSINNHIVRNEGANMGTGQKLWKRAKQVIPGGNMLLSKRAEMFLPDRWPAYFSKAKGCKVWDLDGKEYIDMCIMGIGTNTLGYGHSEIDDAVRRTIDNGNMSTFNCPEEVYLVEKLIELHPWADMGRLARSGGEANAIAIRIARAASGKDKVAICGYHGWHDWYLSANLAEDDHLSGHLLPGLDPNGVPKNLKGTVFPFQYNRFNELENLVNQHDDIGVIKMEVSRNQGPEDHFLHKVRKLATERNIILIFDECTSGFRQTFGGLHKLYGVEPDMAMFGKALGNGYAITATIGKRSVMEAAQSTFISSTFWTERIGPTAALKTLEVMEKTKSWETITNIGNSIKDRWKRLAEKYALSIDLWGLPALAGFTIQSENSLAYKTLITQEMLEKGFLAGNSVYACTEHTQEIINQYFEYLDPIFQRIRECEDGRDILSLLKGPVCHAGFKRLN
ncbi:aminotransferase class III-fold pyridoxal phosphate-dependent enzyme [Leptospira noguchii]|uniref:aminotransferase class III-fold pyridoxal phosphate-dependent enzyme n=1 Tax=Leptospira noguchii TaxID=28182 RepID=UPI001F05A4A8|nr:aminotransferase class III-fold pyridoxal phosphate-dependent enzyme [Leptospira noguchii]MCH1913324.1 aminotransferase class III-fold pyridoxal phosphate-dependent enzyme [Leptospira noguchii]MCH1915413.1 aminotransferase class III-fold pyridoxal phosphate-dependent enzyme [Leptospira noguchii]UOG65262.1 aminotransferase class III-fold pyridoxal phosphate-dependent enzyme [Leptospira noguchii]